MWFSLYWIGRWGRGSGINIIVYREEQNVKPKYNGCSIDGSKIISIIQLTGWIANFKKSGKYLFNYEKFSIYNNNITVYDSDSKSDSDFDKKNLMFEINSTPMLLILEFLRTEKKKKI